jgi:hypothetical protein
MSALLLDDMLPIIANATFSDDRVYRYRLWREWNSKRPPLTFLMLNPSTADEHQLDPTCKGCVKRAIKWGYGELWIINLFALKSTDPQGLYEHVDPVGPDNDEHIAEVVDFTYKRSGIVIAGWGSTASCATVASSCARRSARWATCSTRCTSTPTARRSIRCTWRTASADRVSVIAEFLTMSRAANRIDEVLGFKAPRWVDEIVFRRNIDRQNDSLAEIERAVAEVVEHEGRLIAALRASEDLARSLGHDVIASDLRGMHKQLQRTPPNIRAFYQHMRDPRT